jgi:hypothetical protein
VANCAIGPQFLLCARIIGVNIQIRRMSDRAPTRDPDHSHDNDYFCDSFE